MEDGIRTGFVSSRNPETGMVQVTYPDRDRMVTDDFPVLCFGGEYDIPQVNDLVLVAHLSNDVSSGVIIGKYWNNKDIPKQGWDWYKNVGSGVFFGAVNGAVEMQDSTGRFTIREFLELERRVAQLEERE